VKNKEHRYFGDEVDQNLCTKERNHSGAVKQKKSTIQKK